MNRRDFALGVVLAGAFAGAVASAAILINAAGATFPYPIYS